MNCVFLTLLIFQATLPQQSPAASITSGHFRQQSEIRLDSGWRYRPGDNNAWALPAFDDGAWIIADTRLPIGNMPSDKWEGIGWFRLHLNVDSTLLNRSLLLISDQAGALEVYLEGDLVYSTGDDGEKDTGPPIATISFRRTANIVAVRYSNSSTEQFHDAGFPAGFVLSLGQPDIVLESSFRRTRENERIQVFLTTLALAFAILHLVLFFFSPESKSNLYFSLFALYFAGNIFFDYQALNAASISGTLTALRVHRGIMPLGPITGLLFLYSIFESRVPWQYWIITVVLLATGFLAVLKPVEDFAFVQVAGIIATIESARVILGGMRRRADGAWIIATGFALLFLFSSYDGMVDLGILEQVGDIRNGYPFGFIGLLLCMSVYLARNFARRKERILEQEREAREHEIQQRILSADNARKTKELEEARDLQLSMLPKELPRLPHLEVAVYMKPATEVGGDYYDFHTAPDGTLTIAVGDATGHGARAGTMVTITKSLFSELASTEDLREIFERYTHAIKLLNLDQLYMGLTLARIRDHTVTVSIAGMPPVAVYRASDRRAEEILLRGMPLGCFSQFPYQAEELTVAAGDTIVLMSDGLPEMFNQDSETMEFSRILKIIELNGNLPPSDLINCLRKAGESWADGKPQNDDVTFVVVRVRK